MGRLVAPGPLGPVNVVADAVGRLGSDEQRAEVLPGLLDGSEVAAWCGPRTVDATRRSDGRLALQGSCSPVEAAGSATHLLLSVRTDEGPAQVLVRSDAPGVAVTPLDGLDLVRRFARVDLDGAVVDDGAVLGSGVDVGAELRRLGDLACVIQCAGSVGAIDRVFSMTLEYLGDRWSFGRPLASYQALKHRMADDKMWLEACHAIATAAARAVATGAADASEVVSAAKVWIGPHATEMVQDCIQLHGGIGVTWEHDLHLYLRRVTVDRASHGTPEEHAERIASQLIGVTS
jgi:alkylation response protein AidB-like acyl-CoA dehydrogenase